MKRLALFVSAALLALAPAALHADVPSSSAAPQRLPRPPEERLLRRLRHAQELVAGEPNPLSSPSSSATPPPPAPSGSATKLDSLRAELAKKWAELAATRHERRERHRAALLREVGAHLSSPAVKAELALHASHVADLARIEFLAQNARTGADRQKLLARVAKASERETERHQRRMTKLLAITAPAASGAPEAAPAPASLPSTEAPR